MKDSVLDLATLIGFFPEIKPPVTLSADSSHRFSAENRPFPETITAYIFNNWDSGDEYTEFLPCLRLAVSDNFHTLIYWKGSLLSHEYILVTISNKLELISKKVIAGTISNGKTINSSVAHIDDEYYIYSTSGVTHTDSKYDPTRSTAFSFMILPNGQLESFNEKLFPN